MTTDVLIIINRLNEITDVIVECLGGVCASVMLSSLFVGMAIIAHKFMKGGK